MNQHVMQAETGANAWISPRPFIQRSCYVILACPTWMAMRSLEPCERTPHYVVSCLLP